MFKNIYVLVIDTNEIRKYEAFSLKSKAQVDSMTNSPLIII